MKAVDNTLRAFKTYVDVLNSIDCSDECTVKAVRKSFVALVRAIGDEEGDEELAYNAIDSIVEAVLAKKSAECKEAE